MWRPRAAGRDLGAFESTTAFTAVGAYDIAPLPRLATAKSGTDLVVSWPLFASDFQLQSSIAVSAAVWADASWSLVTNANGISTSISAPGGPRFYRLRK